jgi:hypothetical protein
MVPVIASICVDVGGRLELGLRVSRDPAEPDRDIEVLLLAKPRVLFAVVFFGAALAAVFFAMLMLLVI